MNVTHLIRFCITILSNFPFIPIVPHTHTHTHIMVKYHSRFVRGCFQQASGVMVRNCTLICGTMWREVTSHCGSTTINFHTCNLIHHDAMWWHVLCNIHLDWTWVLNAACYGWNWSTLIFLIWNIPSAKFLSFLFSDLLTYIEVFSLYSYYILIWYDIFVNCKWVDNRWQ